MQTITRRLLALWQEQVSLMAQDPEISSYGESMFKMLGVTMPQEGLGVTMPQEDTAETPIETPPTNPSPTGATPHEPAEENGPTPDALSPEQRTAMVDELSRRINELAGQIAEHEGSSLPSEPTG